MALRIKPGTHLGGEGSHHPCSLLICCTLEPRITLITTSYLGQLAPVHQPLLADLMQLEKKKIGQDEDLC